MAVVLLAYFSVWSLFIWVLFPMIWMVAAVYGVQFALGSDSGRGDGGLDRLIAALGANVVMALGGLGLLALTKWALIVCAFHTLLAAALVVRLATRGSGDSESTGD